MHKFLMSLAALGVIAFSVPFGVAYADDALPGAVPTAAQLTEGWRAYFQNIQNLPAWTYASRMQLWETDAKTPAAAPHLISDINVKIAQAGPSFRREMKVREDAQAAYQVVIMTYDGKKYQMAVNNPKPTDIGGHAVKALMLQGGKPFPDDPTLTTSVHFPLTMPFLFAGDNMDALPFAALQTPEFWTTAQKRIMKIEPATWGNYKGYTVTFKKEKEAAQPVDERIEAFVDATTGLPLHLVTIDNKTGNTRGEMKVTQLSQAAGQPAFPLHIDISGTGTQEGKPGNPGNPGTGTIDVDPATLNLAATLKASDFTVPSSSMEIVMEGDKIVYSRYPMPKPPAKPAPKPAAKTPAKPAPKTPASQTHHR